MTNKVLAITFLFLFTVTNSFSQINMQKGFKMLETGKNKQASIFFENVLEQEPNNKTAKVCYGRAVGLSGNPDKAINIFTNLLSKYPNDLEVKLNYAESLLWSKQFIKAKSYYKKLVDENPTSFSALLGYANTLSNLKEYTDAMSYINKALEVSPGNPNAMVSKKYIRLGHAYKYQQEKKYDEAIKLLDDNLQDFKLDKQTILNKANVFLIKNEPAKAKEAYKLMATNPKDSIIALNGLALVSHLQFKDKKALELAQNAHFKVKKFENDTLLTKQTKERYIQALIWNQKYKFAEKEIDTLLTKKPNTNWILSLHASLATYKSDFKESIADYNQILKNDPKSFDGNLGGANAQLANGNEKKAYEAAYQTLTIFKEQKDALNFIKNLDLNFTPFVEEKVAFTFDNGNNNAFSSTTTIDFPISFKLKATATYQFRTTENTITNNKATTNDFTVGLSYKIRPKISLNANIGVNSANSFSNDFTQLLLQAFVKLKPLKLQDLEIGYKREIQSFNADLLDKEIVADNFYINNNFSTNFNLGWFTQFFYTPQNDGNTRNLLFTSLYYNFLKRPILKGGINYQFLTFQNQVPTIYFSPSKFNAVELFADLLKDEKTTKPKNWFYTVSGAVGYQFIEEDPKQLTYRGQVKLGYKFSDRFLANIYAQHTNIASATAAGFKFTEIGFRLKWYFLSKPIFKTHNFKKEDL